MKTLYRILAFLAVALVAFALGFVLRGAGTPDAPAAADQIPAAKAAKVEVWTCSMHPNIRRPGPGQCPLCGMDLIPVSSGDDDDLGPRELKLSPAAVQLAGIQTAPVERKHVSAEIRMVGKVDYDETRLARITAWIAGRLDRLFVDYTGVPVKKGDHMVYLYSPELMTAQEELLQAKRAVEELRSSELKSMRETAALTVEATREKLRLWGLSEDQVAEIEKRGKASDHMTINAPIGGIVIEKKAVEGMYVKTGSLIYTIADLTQLWVKLDAYESDLMWIRYGQKVDIETDAYPGEVFEGTIAFIDPVLDAKTRTVKVRVNVPNADGRLKPEMFVRATVEARVAKGGKVMDAELAGKWMCPMHPEIVKDEAGSCDLCGMPLRTVESLGYAAVAEDDGAPLVIPASAPLQTGKRAVVYVASPDREGVFEGREIVLGPRAGDYYLVREGLEEGEQVVVNGNFKIDSALQILAKPSMMSPEGGAPVPGHGGHSATKDEETKEETHLEAPKAFLEQLDAVLAAYLQIHHALSTDDATAAKAGAQATAKALEAVDMALVSGEAHMSWMAESASLSKAAGEIEAAAEIAKQREAFLALSESLTTVVKRFGTNGQRPVLQFLCAMAFENRGAHWLQSEEDAMNPYFGKAMQMCGEKTAVLSAGPE